MKLPQHIVTLVCLLVMMNACRYAGKQMSHGPIVLGDSSTIVSENDSTYLKDMVAEITPALNSGQQDPATPKVATANSQLPGQKVATPTPTPTPGAGLNIAFKEVTVFIPNINTKSYRNQNLQNANGASYQLASGDLNGNQLKILSGNVTRVSQRYQTIITLRNDAGTLPLDALSTTTEWQPLKGNSNTYYIAGLETARLAFTKASTSAIHNAVAKAARAHRVNSRKAKQFMESVKNVRATNQSPLTVVLKSVIYKIEGKNAQGKIYQKQIRIDMPL